jgi:lysozyme
MYSAACVALTQRFEQCSLESYPDVNGIWTIGWGDTGVDIIPKLLWTQAQCDVALRARLKEANRYLNFYASGPFLQGTEDALTDFIYNAGIGTYIRNPIRRLVDGQQWAAVKADLLNYVHDKNGDVLDDLVKRRQAEAAMIVVPEQA